MYTLDNISSLCGVPVDELRALAATLVRVADTLRLPIGGTAILMCEIDKPDARVLQWAARIRIFSDGELLADSDPDNGDDPTGSEICLGLLAVASYAATLIATFHGPSADAVALQAAFEARQVALRVAISRGKTGGAVWTVPYFIDDVRYHARVDVQRVSQSNARVKRILDAA